MLIGKNNRKNGKRKVKHKLMELKMEKLRLKHKLIQKLKLKHKLMERFRLKHKLMEKQKLWQVKKMKIKLNCKMTQKQMRFRVRLLFKKKIFPLDRLGLENDYQKN